MLLRTLFDMICTFSFFYYGRITKIEHAFILNILLRKIQLHKRQIRFLILKENNIYIYSTISKKNVNFYNKWNFLTTSGKLTYNKYKFSKFSLHF